MLTEKSSCLGWELNIDKRNRLVEGALKMKLSRFIRLGIWYWHIFSPNMISE